jgi:hypothetical protein
MKIRSVLSASIAMSFMFIAASFNDVKAQSDTTKVVSPDTTVQKKGKEKDDKKEDKKRKDEFILYTGINFSELDVASTVYESGMRIGYQVGGAYKRGKFFYWQLGARFSNSVYELKEMGAPADSSKFEPLAVRGLDIPVTVGINFLSFTNRILALRVFVSAVPAFTLGVGDNDLGLVKDDLNTFILYGQGGIGVDVAFLVLEVGYNYGFHQDLFKDDVQSVPGQVFINLGFRF